eukprot:1950087-Amphidinium_carterae.1
MPLTLPQMGVKQERYQTVSNHVQYWRNVTNRSITIFHFIVSSGANTSKHCNMQIRHDLDAALINILVQGPIEPCPLVHPELGPEEGPNFE